MGKVVGGAERGRTLGEGEDRFIEGNVTGCVDALGGDVIALVAFVFGWVTDKDAGKRSWREFVLNGGRKIWKAKTAVYM
jgi:hypothetical protein